MSKREPRSDSVLGSLPQNQQEQLDYWLFEERPKVTAEQILERLRLDFGVSVAPSTLSEWKKRRREDRELDSIIASAVRSNAVIERAEKNPGDTYKALQLLITSHALNSSGAPEEQETLLAFVDRAIKFKREESRGEAVAVLKQKFQRDTCELFLKWAEDQRAKDIMASGESNAAKIERLGQAMFGDLWGKKSA